MVEIVDEPVCVARSYENKVYFCVVKVYIYVLSKLKAGKKHLLSIRTCVYLVLSAGRSTSRFLHKSPEFFTVVSRFSVLLG